LIAIGIFWAICAMASVSAAPLPMGLERQNFMPYGQRWLGADAAYMTPIPAEAPNEPKRYLWFFDDTITGVRDRSDRNESLWVHNTIGVMAHPSDKNISESVIDYFWGNENKTEGVFLTGLETQSDKDVPVEFYWQNDNLIVDDKLYIFLQRTRSVNTGLGFEAVGTAIVTVPNYRESPLKWKKQYQVVTGTGTFVVAQALAYGAGVNGNPYPKDPNGANYLYSFTNVDPVNQTAFTALMRFPFNKLSNASQLTGNWQYWTTDETWTQWTPDPTFSLVPSNMQKLWPTQPGTIRFHSQTQQWINVAPSPKAFFGGGATYSISETKSITGPWPALAPLYEIPETNQTSPYYIPEAWCYATFEHPEYESVDGSDLAFTYCCNSQDYNKLMSDDRVYRAELVKVPWPKSSSKPNSLKNKIRLVKS